jgi:hypothetical protein
MVVLSLDMINVSVGALAAKFYIIPIMCSRDVVVEVVH